MRKICEKFDGLHPECLDHTFLDLGVDLITVVVDDAARVELGH